MGKEIKEILKKGRKDKLIQLAIDHYLASPSIKTLSEDETAIIRDRANKEGWAGELERAVTKSGHIIGLGQGVERDIYKAIHLLTMIREPVRSIETTLCGLFGIYLKDWSDEEETFKTVVKKPREEIRADINIFKRAQVGRIQATLHGLGAPNTYIRFIKGGKEGAYLLINSKIGGYKFYTKEAIEPIKYALWLNRLEVGDFIDSLDWICFYLEGFEKYNSDIVKELLSEKIITEDAIKEYKRISSELSDLIVDIGGPIEQDPNRRTKEGYRDEDGTGIIMDRMMEEEYLLRGLSKDEIKELDSVIERVVKDVKYGR